MLIKEAVYEIEMVERKKIISQAVYGCDMCKEEIKEYPNEGERLEITVFYKKMKNTDYFHFCSWECVLKFISKIKSDYFISLPHVYFDSNKKSKKSGYELIRLLEKKEK